jgi:hypothetical protein
LFFGDEGTERFAIENMSIIDFYPRDGGQPGVESVDELDKPGLRFSR